MSDNKETKRNRATMAPGGCECSKCGCIFIGGETHTECGICANEPKQAWAPERIWLQRGVGDDGSHTWCSDSQDEHEEAEYVRVDVQAPAVEAKSYDPFNPIDGVIAKKSSFIDEHIKAIEDAIRSGTGVTVTRIEPDDLRAKEAPAIEAWARDDDAAIAACALMIMGICLTRPQEVWVSDIKSRIRYMLAALARASEVGQVSKGWKLVPAEPTVEMLNAALPHDVTFGHGFKRRIYQEMIAAAPQPASEQQPVPQLFADTGDAVRGTFGKTVFAEMSNSDDLWSVWLDGWLRASEQQAARGLSDDVRSRLEFYAACYCKSTSATDREAGKAMYALLAAKGDGQ